MCREKTRIFAQFLRPDESGPAKSVSGLPCDEIEKIIRFVDVNMDKHIGIEELDGLLSYKLSFDHFTRRFKVSFGMSPMQYLRKRRMEKADELLRAGQKNVGEVAEAVGFRDQGHFSRCFWNYFKRLPITVRKSALAADSRKKIADGSMALVDRKV